MSVYNPGKRAHSRVSEPFSRRIRLGRPLKFYMNILILHAGSAGCSTPDYREIL